MPVARCLFIAAIRTKTFHAACDPNIIRLHELSSLRGSLVFAIDQISVLTLFAVSSPNASINSALADSHSVVSVCIAVDR